MARYGCQANFWAKMHHELVLMNKGTLGSIYCTQGRGGGPQGLTEIFGGQNFIVKCALDTIWMCCISLLGLHLPDCMNNMQQLATYYKYIT